MNSNIREVWNMFKVNPIKDGHFRGCSQMGGQKALTLLHLSHISYNDVDWYIYTLPKEDQKNTKITWHTPWFLLTSAFFHQKSGNFVISTNTDKDCILAQNLSLFLNSLESWKIFLINLVIILMMSAKMVTPGLFKITVFWNNDYGVIIHVDDVTNKIRYHVIQIIL